MKGMMVVLLTLVTVVSAATKVSAQQTKEGKFVLWLDDALLEQLKTNPEGLIAQIDKELQGKITDVVIKYRAPDPVTTQKMGTTEQTVARPDFDNTTANNNSTSGTTGGINSRIGSTQLPNRPFGAQSPTANQRFGSSPSTERIQQTAGISAPATNQEWMAVGDDTDFVPVTRRNWVGRQENQNQNQRIANNNTGDFRNQIQNSKVAEPFLPTRRDQQLLTQDDQFTSGSGIRNQGAQRQQPLNSNTNTWDQDRLSNRRLLAQTPQPQTNPGLIQNYNQGNNFNQNPQTFQQPIQQQNRQNYVERNQQLQPMIPYGNQQVVGSQQAAPNQQIVYQPYQSQNYSPVQYPSNQFPRRHVPDNYENNIYDQAVAAASIPNRRVAQRNNARPSTSSRTSLTTTQIPGPNDQTQQQSTQDSSQLSNLTLQQQEQILANANSYKRTNGFLLFMLLCSVGINIYLGLISRSFYTRYSELADELRETFTATM